MRFKEFQIEDAVMKNKVIRYLNKRPDSDPIFPNVYKVLVGEPITTRINNYVKMRGDKDALAAVSYLDRIIPTLGSVSEVKEFLNDFKKSNYDLISINKLCPKSGMSNAEALSNVVENSFAKKLFNELSGNYRGKNDAGPGEAALAILSPNITYAQGATVDDYGRGGDIIVNGVGKVEVKGGEGGRLVSRVNLDQSRMAEILQGYKLFKYKKPKVVKAKRSSTKQPKPLEPLSSNVQSAVANFLKSRNEPQAQEPKVQEPQDQLDEGSAGMASITAFRLSQPLPEDFPAKEFVRAASIAWFDEVREHLVNAVGTPAFKRLWFNDIFDAYREYAGWTGILFVTDVAYQYTVTGDQIPDEYISSFGSLYYPKSKQSRDLAPQVKPIL